ncbi:hypothetical protein ACFE04_022096 [Oxalis oulophora]
MGSSSFSWMPMQFMVMVHGAFSCEVEAARAFFVFGDSLVDGGNNINNYLQTFARADELPYGIDFPTDHQATGRFSNGYNIPDIISEKIGSVPLLPYLSPELT